MDVYSIGFLLGLFISGFSIVAFWMTLLLALSVMRTLQKRDTGIKIIIYVIETAVPLSIVIALSWLASNISYNANAYWLGVTLTIAFNGFVLLWKTPQGTGLGLTWKVLKGELTGGKMGDNQKTN